MQKNMHRGCNSVSERRKFGTRTPPSPQHHMYSSRYIRLQSIVLHKEIFSHPVFPSPPTHNSLNIRPFSFPSGAGASELASVNLGMNVATNLPPQIASCNCFSSKVRVARSPWKSGSENVYKRLWTSPARSADRN